MTQEMMTDYPDETDREVLTILRRERRANPKLIRDETGLDKGTVNTVLVRAGRHGDVTQVERGLYDYTGDDAARTIPAETVRGIADDLEAALERGESGEVKAVLDRLREVVDDAR